MSAGRDRYESRLRRGLSRGRSAQLYVRRRTAKRGNDRVLVNLTPPVRYALCVWASYRAGLRAQAVSQELRTLIWEGLRRRLGPDAETIIEDAYEAYAKECAEAGEQSIFEVAR